jgi:hypothetical protein
MNLYELQTRAEKEVSLDYDAWANLNDSERQSLTYKKMLQLLEEEGKDLLRHQLIVAKAAWDSEAWSWTGYHSFVEFLCDVGGRYRQEDGRPSGTAYDLAGFVTTAWPVLEEAGYNPIEVAAQGWSKARLTVSTIRGATRMLNSAGQEVTRPEEATSVTIRPDQKGQVIAVVETAMDPDISVREMMEVYCQRRVDGFIVDAKLRKDGVWEISGELTNQQFSLLQRLAARHMDVRLV